MTIRLLASFSLFVLLPLISKDACASESDRPSIEVGLTKQLFVDDWVVAEQHNLKRTLGTVQKANDSEPLVFTRTTKSGKEVPFDCWALAASVSHDADRNVFRMWHRISFDDVSQQPTEENLSSDDIGLGSGYFRGYSESVDGIHFSFVSKLQGLTTSGDTNLVVTLDEHESDPAHRYKIGYDADTRVHGAALAHSSDGIHWTPYNDGQPVTYRACDFTNQILWDQEVQAYRLYTRTDFGNGGGPLAGTVDVPVGDQMLEVRGVRSMINPHFKNNPTGWQLERHWLLDGEVDHPANRPPIEQLLKDPDYLEQVREQALRRQAYIMTAWLFEGVHFGLLAVLEWPSDVSEGTESDFVTRHEKSVENFYIITSRDGVSWNFHWVYAGEPLVPRGPSGAWDKDMVFPTSQIVTHNDKHWIYYGGTNERHVSAERNVWFQREGSIGLAWLRLDGFVGIEAGTNPGTLTTKPFLLQGANLELNLDARPDGVVRVEVLDANGQPIPDFSGENSAKLSGVDHLRATLAWPGQSDLSQLKNQVVQLKFHLTNSRLYAFQVCP